MNPAAILLLLLALCAPAAQAIEESVRVSAFQGPCRDGDFPANLAAARSAVEQARERGSQFLVLPECFLSGYESADAVRRGARALGDTELRAFIAESASHDVVVLAGLARRDGETLLNSVLVIHRGRLLGSCDKVMLTRGDREVLGFSAGTGVAVFQAHGVRFAVAICADTSYPFSAMAARLQGAELLFTPHYNEIAESSVDDHRRWVRNCHVGLAAQFRMAVARANVVKTDRPGRVGCGDSFILSPQGEPLAEAHLFRTELVTATLTPEMFRNPYTWGDLDDTPPWLRSTVADLLTAYRPPRDEADLREWLTNMVVHHGYSPVEVSTATGLPRHEVDEAIRRWDLANVKTPTRTRSDPLRVLPFPGGRHPRRGFFDGAVNPQRETKVSVFAPWPDGGYVVVDAPEAIFSNLGLTYLAHTHIPTIWSAQGLELPRLEWVRHPDGRLTMDRVLPNGIAFGTEVSPGSDGLRFNLWLRNGTPHSLTGLRIQNCVMLGAAPGFTAQSLTNKVFQAPFAAARSTDGNRWILTAWERCGRTWGNELVPCLHSDPVLADCPPGKTVQVAGWLSFYEGADVASEMARLREARVTPATTTP